MAGEQGTGKHPHKSAAEPFEHHEASTSKGEKTSGQHEKPAPKSSTHESSGDEGTGKHPHKKASDPKEHHEGAKK